MCASFNHLWLRKACKVRALSHSTHSSPASLPCTPARDMCASQLQLSAQNPQTSHSTNRLLVYGLKAVTISKTLYYPAQWYSVPQTIQIPPIYSKSPPPIPRSKHGDSILLSGDGNLSIHPGNLTGTRPSAEWQMNYGMPRGQQGWRHLPTPQHLALCPCTTARLQHVRCACAEMGHELCTSEGAPDF